MKKYLSLIIAVFVPVPWIILALTGRSHHLTPVAVSLLSGLAIVGGSFVLSWGAELLERDIPRSLALIALALISVLPEYAIGLHYAWAEGKAGTHDGLSIANMTGANRILIGVGWALVVLVYFFKFRKRSIPLDPSQGLELSLLLMATIYTLIIPLKGTLTWIDTVILFAMFVYYAARALQGETHEGELEGVAAIIDEKLGNSARRFVVLLMFAFAGYVIWLAAEPFAEGLKAAGTQYGVNQFLLVQWLAPLASESPEGLIALLFALKGRGSTGIGALISSKVNQWTLLVGAIPLAYGLAATGMAPMILDNRQKEELLLTSAQSFFAAVILSDFQLSVWEGLLLFALFAVQLFFPDTQVRYAFSAAYLGLGIALLAFSKQRRSLLWRALTFRN